MPCRMMSIKFKYGMKKQTGTIQIAILLLLLTGLTGCGHQKWTLEKLKTANWKQLDTGIEYISLESGKMQNPDSVRYAVIGITDTKGTTISLPVKNDVQDVMSTLINQVLTNKLPASKQGYLRLNLYEMRKKDLAATIYLKNTYDTSNLNTDIEMLGQLPGVSGVVYISKDSARKKYLADGNEDWNLVLNENPLPASIDFYFNRKEITPEQYEEIGNIIRENMSGIGHIDFRDALLAKWDERYFIIRYQRD